MRPAWSTWKKRVNEVHEPVDFLRDSLEVNCWAKCQRQYQPEKSFRHQLRFSRWMQQSGQNIKNTFTPLYDMPLHEIVSP